MAMIYMNYQGSFRITWDAIRIATDAERIHSNYTELCFCLTILIICMVV